MSCLDFLSQHEGKTLEFKRDDSPAEAIARTAVEFANTAGGQIVIGVADRSREIIGVSDPLRTEERLENILSDRVSPRLVPDIEVLAWRDTALVAPPGGEALTPFSSASGPLRVVASGILE